MSKSIRPLTIAEKRKPAQNVFHGGFKNVSFQVGEIVDLPPTSIEQSTPGTNTVILKKGEKIQFPIRTPQSVPLMRGQVNLTCTTMGARNQYGSYEAMLVVRNCERLSSFNTSLRTINELINSDSKIENEAAPDRLGKGYAARLHNQVSLCGVVVGTRFEGGENPKFHISLRQDANPENIIPLIYDAKNAETQVNRIKYGTLIFVDGEFAYRKVPALQIGEDGQILLNEDGTQKVQVDADGNVVNRIHTYIRITPPKEPRMEWDVNFGDTPPRWLTEMAKDMDERKKRYAGNGEAKSPIPETKVTETSDLEGL